MTQNNVEVAVPMAELLPVLALSSPSRRARLAALARFFSAIISSVRFIRWFSIFLVCVCR